MQKVEDINFPIYRKYKNGKRFYKIINKKEFEEIQVIGTKIIINHIKATQLPEFNFINDLIGDYKGFAEVLTEEEFVRLKNM
jgi:hypothetical protein